MLMFVCNVAFARESGPLLCNKQFLRATEHTGTHSNFHYKRYTNMVFVENGLTALSARRQRSGVKL